LAGAPSGGDHLGRVFGEMQQELGEADGIATFDLPAAARGADQAGYG
jgi:hypothetical protein